MTSNTELAPDFGWTRFYEEFATKLLAFRNDRTRLVNGLHDIVGTDDQNRLLPKHYDMRPLIDRIDREGPATRLEDICPFTVMGLFNHDVRFPRSLTPDDARRDIAQKIATLLGVDVPVPSDFEAIPVIERISYWFFGYSYLDNPSNIVELLWNFFEDALRFARSGSDAHDMFTESYDGVARYSQRARNLSIGLYWARPLVFQCLTESTQEYISNTLGMRIDDNYRDGRRYLMLLDSLKEKFQEPDSPVRSFQQLTYAAHSNNSEIAFPATSMSEPEEDAPSQLRPYKIANILEDGCFLDDDKLSEILNRLKIKKNLILQGPPGTGKTWLGKRLAYALVGERDDDRVRSFQFHPNMSYEDFVRGYRPNADGKLDLVDGPFMEMVDAAKADPGSKYAMVIEEINRGNPAQIFGEMLTLLEADKRKPEEALRLVYPKEEGEQVYIPDNLYVIGTMNVADRSLALVDFALRRRFAFVNLEPALNERWLGWVSERCGIDAEFLSQIRDKFDSLNETITGDRDLGPQFKIGHSFVTPTIQIHNASEWYRQVVETEIGPLLDEYWFDAPDRAREAKDNLLSGIF